MRHHFTYALPKPMTHLPWRPILCAFLYLLFSTALFARPVFSPASAAADSSDRPVLLVFSGSDWCQPCIRFEKQVLSDAAFRQFAETRLDVVKADFPQRKKLPPEIIRENERLAERYNPEGGFPHVVLLRADRSVWAVLPSNARNGGEFVGMLESYLSSSNGSADK